MIDANDTIRFDHLIFEKANMAIRAEHVSYTVSHSTFRDFNDANAILYNSDVALSINESLFEDNAISGPNGAIIFGFESSIEFLSSRFQNNESDALQTFASCVLFSNDSDAEFTNCVLYNNDCSINRMPDYLTDNNTLDLINCSFKGNDPAECENFETIYASANAYNCVLWDDKTLDFIHSTTLPVGLDVKNSFVPPSFPLASGVNLSHLDPGLIAPNLELMPGSPAEDYGDNSLNSTVFDIAGTQRVKTSIVGCDIDAGAYEMGTICPPGPPPASLDLESLDDLAFELYPNPSSDLFMVSFPQTQTGIMKIYSAEGALIWEKSFGDVNNLRIDLGDYSSGIYQMVIITDEGQMTSKLVKL